MKTSPTILEQIGKELARRNPTDPSIGYRAANQAARDEISLNWLPHHTIADMVRMVTRDAVLLEPTVVAARDRIAWLAGRVEALEAEVEDLKQAWMDQKAM